jgi:hypothetical protein
MANTAEIPFRWPVIRRLPLLNCCHKTRPSYRQMPIYLDPMNRRQAVSLIGLSADAYARPSASSRLIGVWKFRSCVRSFKDGRSDYPFGEKPVGRIEYDKAGRMYALLMRPGRRSTLLPGKPFPEANNEELRDAVTGFVAYFGTFDIEETTHTVIHHVEASLVPNWVGTDLKRRFRFDGGHLILTLSNPDSSLNHVFERESD